MSKYPMTSFGAEQLEKELQRLKTVERPNVIKAISEARSHGDLSENAEYAAARELQSFIEGRILELEHKLSHAQIIEPRAVVAENIVFGATVTLLDLETEKTVQYQLVGDDEANIKSGKISVNSPVARSLIGKECGDTIEAKIPSGTKEYEILKIQYI